MNGDYIYAVITFLGLFPYLLVVLLADLRVLGLPLLRLQNVTTSENI